LAWGHIDEQSSRDSSFVGKLVAEQFGTFSTASTPSKHWALRTAPLIWINLVIVTFCCSASLGIIAGISQSEGRTEERAMSQMVKILLRRALLTLGGIFVWAKALAGGSGATDKKTAGGQERKPNREP
jgi:hypothetical protein